VRRRAREAEASSHDQRDRGRRRHASHGPIQVVVSRGPFGTFKTSSAVKVAITDYWSTRAGEMLVSEGQSPSALYMADPRGRRRRTGGLIGLLEMMREMHEVRSLLISESALCCAHTTLPCIDESGSGVGIPHRVGPECVDVLLSPAGHELRGTTGWRGVSVSARWLTRACPFCTHPPATARSCRAHGQCQQRREPCGHGCPPYEDLPG
jgi:hypothetical protein